MIEPASESEALLERVRPVLETARDRGLMGPGDLEGHVRNAMAFARAIPTDARVLDLGSGGGVPGIPLAVHRSDLRVTLLEAASRRIRFLDEAVDLLARAEPDIVERLHTLWGRAEDVGLDRTHRARFDVVVARSFGRPAVVAECGRSLLATGGVLIVSEPPQADPQRWPAEPLALMALELSSSYRLGESNFVVLEATGECPDGIPRRAGVPERRPRF